MLSSVGNLSVITPLPKATLHASCFDLVRRVYHCIVRLFKAYDRWLDENLGFPLDRFFERYLIVPINLWWHSKKYFAQFHGDSYLYKATGYTGAWRSIALLHMIKNLENHLTKYPTDREKVTPILESLNGSLKLTIFRETLEKSNHRKTYRLKKMAQEICRNVAKLRRNRFIAIPCGWGDSTSSHAIILMIKRNSSGLLERHIINTGEGINKYHKSLIELGTGKIKYEKTSGYLAEKDEDFCEPDFYQAILESAEWMNMDPDKVFYEDIWQTSKGKKIDTDPNHHLNWQTGQRGGTCAFRTVLQLVLLQYGDAEKAELLHTQLLEEDLRKRFTWYKSKWIKNPNCSDRVLLENAAHHLIHKKEKGGGKAVDLTLEKEVLNYIKTEYRGDNEVSKWSFSSPGWSSSATIKIHGETFTWNKNKKYYEYSFGGTTYQVSKNQAATFLCGFKDFVVLEDSQGHRKVLIPKYELEPFNKKDVLAPFIGYKGPLKEMILCSLNENGKLKPTHDGDFLYLAALAFAMRRYELVRESINSIETLALGESTAYPADLYEFKDHRKVFFDQSLDISNIALSRQDRDPTALALALQVSARISLSSLCLFKEAYKEKDWLNRFELYIDKRVKPITEILNSNNNKNSVRRDIFPNFSQYLCQINNEFADLFRSMESKVEEKDLLPVEDNFKNNEIEKEKQWSTLYHKFRLSFPLTEASLNKVSLTQPKQDFYLCFFHYYSILQAKGCSNNDRERIMRRLSYMRSDRSLLNQHMRTVLIDLYNFPHRYKPLAEAKDPISFKDFFASLKY